MSEHVSPDSVFWSMFVIIAALALVSLVMLGLTAANTGPYL